MCSVLSMTAPGSALLKARGPVRPPAGLGRNLLLCYFGFLDGRGFDQRGLLLLSWRGLLLRLGWGKSGFGFGEEIELVLARDADVTGEGEAKRKGCQLLIGGGVDGGQQQFFGAALFVLVLGGDILGQIIGKGVGVEVDDGAEDNPQLSGGEAGGGCGDDALERGLPCLALLVSRLACSASYRFSSCSCCCLNSSALRSCSASWALRCSSCCCFRASASSSVSAGGAGGMTGAGCSAALAAARGSWMGQLLSVQTVRVVPTRLPVDDDGGFCGLANCYGFRIGVLAGGVDFAVGAAADGSGALLLGGAVSVLDLHQLGTGCDFAVDVGVYLGVEARGVEALVALHVGKQGSIESAAAGASNASSCGWV